MRCLVVEIATQTIMARCARCCNRGVYQPKHTSEEGATSYGEKATGRLNKDGDISTGSWWKNLSSPDCYSPYSSFRSKLSSIFPLQVTMLRLYHKEKGDYMVSRKRIIQRVVWRSNMAGFGVWNGITEFSFSPFLGSASVIGRGGGPLSTQVAPGISRFSLLRVESW